MTLSGRLHDYAEACASSDQMWSDHEHGQGIAYGAGAM